MKLKNPGWLLVIPCLLRSMRGEMGYPLSRSRSPWQNICTDDQGGGERDGVPALPLQVNLAEHLPSLIRMRDDGGQSVWEGVNRDQGGR